MYEKPSEFAAQFKFTVLLMPNGPHKITGSPIDLDCYQSECVVEDPELKVFFLFFSLIFTIRNEYFVRHFFLKFVIILSRMNMRDE